VRRFGQLYAELESTGSTTRKVEAMARYFREAPAADACWGLFFLTGRRQKRVLSIRALAGSLLGTLAISDWLLEECFAAVGDLGEVIALLVPGEEHAPAEMPLSEMAERIRGLGELLPEAQGAAAMALVRQLDARGRFLFIKMLTGELRVGASELLALRGLEKASGVPRRLLAERILGSWEPSAERWQAFTSAETSARGGVQPYPFFLATPLEDPRALGDARDFLAEWKWDGIRCQLVRRGEIALWSRGEELVTERFPELVEAAARLPIGTVLDGEAIPLDAAGVPLPFAEMQRRIGRKKLGAKILSEVPMFFVAYDLLEDGGADLRERPLAERRALLEARVKDVHPRLVLSPRVEGETWEALAAARERSRERRVEGLMLKRLSGAYGVGRTKGDLFKWKIAPFEVDAVMIVAHPGHGRRGGLYTDYTFGVWHEGTLVPIARAYSGLDEAEIDELDRWIRAHTRERYGPSRAVEPVQVFTLHFEGVMASSRHKTGIAVRFPRIARWRKDKPASEAGTLEELRALLAAIAG
jgi:DNA ligase-1